MSKIIIENASERTQELLRTAILGQIERLQASLERSRARLEDFQKKYGKELSQITAEDLEGGDLEYVEWAGEAELRRRLEDDLRRLRELEIAHR
jgi:hypothetical protein